MDQGDPLVAAQSTPEAELDQLALQTRSSRPTSRSRAVLLKEELRLLYQLEDSRASAPRPLARLASRLQLEPFIKLARTIRRQLDGIPDAIRFGLNSRIRLISHRSFGFHSTSPQGALVYLCCTRILITISMKFTQMS